MREVGPQALTARQVKNMVLAGFKDITLLDLDTIDLSNLNRQFLFRKKDVKQPKAIVSPQFMLTHKSISQPLALRRSPLARLPLSIRLAGYSPSTETSRNPNSMLHGLKALP